MCDTEREQITCWPLQLSWVLIIDKEQAGAELCQARLSLKLVSLTLSRTGGGQIDPNFFSTSMEVELLNVSCWNVLTFPIYPLTKDFRKKIWNFLGGYPYFGPPKPVTDRKWPYMTANDPPILMQNPFPHKKWGCLQKTRALYLKKWLSYGHIKFRKRKSQNFQKNWLSWKIALTRSIFEISSKLFFHMVTDVSL